MPKKFTLRKNGQVMTTMHITRTMHIEKVDLLRYDSMAKKMGYKDYRHYCECQIPDFLTNLQDDFRIWDDQGDSR